MDKKIKNRSEETFRLGYSSALDYFENSDEIMAFLGQLTDEEKEDFVLEIYVNHESKYAQFSIGNKTGASEHLYEKSDKIDNAQYVDDDYEGVLYFLNNYFENYNMDNILKIEGDDLKVIITDMDNINGNMAGNINIKFNIDISKLKDIVDFLKYEIDEEPYTDRRIYNYYNVKIKNLYKADNRFDISGTNLKFSFDADTTGVVDVNISIFIEYLTNKVWGKIFNIQNGDLVKKWIVEIRRV